MPKQPAQKPEETKVPDQDLIIVKNLETEEFTAIPSEEFAGELYPEDKFEIMEDMTPEMLAPSQDPPQPDASEPAEEPEWAEASEERPANIRYVGKVRKFDSESQKTIERLARPDEVPTWRKNGSKVFDLPSGEIQLEGFWHRDAVFLIRAYGTEFKRPVEKGA